MSQLRMWSPSKAEVDRLAIGLRPLIGQLRYRDQHRVATEVLRRRRVRELGW